MSPENGRHSIRAQHWQFKCTCIALLCVCVCWARYQSSWQLFFECGDECVLIQLLSARKRQHAARKEQTAAVCACAHVNAAFAAAFGMVGMEWARCVAVGWLPLVGHLTAQALMNVEHITLQCGMCCTSCHIILLQHSNTRFMCILLLSLI